MVLAASTLLFLVLAPFAKQPLGAADWFIPVTQSVLVFTDLLTVVLLLGQWRVSTRPELLVIAAGYLYAALMAAIHRSAGASRAPWAGT